MRTFTTAQRAADEMLATTRAEADALKVAALAEAASVLASAQTEAAAVVAAANAEAATARHAGADRRSFDRVDCIDLEPAPATPPALDFAPDDTAWGATEEPWRLETAIQRAVNRAVERVPIAPPT